MRWNGKQAAAGGVAAGLRQRQAGQFVVVWRAPSAAAGHKQTILP